MSYRGLCSGGGVVILVLKIAHRPRAGRRITRAHRLEHGKRVVATLFHDSAR